MDGVVVIVIGVMHLNMVQLVVVKWVEGGVIKYIKILNIMLKNKKR